MKKAMTIKRNIYDFLKDYPLYKPFEAVSGYSRNCEGYTDPFMLSKQTFSAFCLNENDIRIFELNTTDSFIKFWSELADDGIHESLIDNNGRLDYIQHFEGVCTSCRKHKISFLLHIYSDQKIPKETVETIFSNPNDDPLIQQPVNIFIEKIGEYPKQKIKIDTEISKVLDRESCNWYFKAKSSLNDKLGIGAFAYFRRIIEKELISLAKEVSELKHSKSEKMKELILEYENSNKVYLIYDNIFEFLPPALKSFGDNPFALLYKQTSMGLHELTEEECLSKAEAIDYVLTFLIKKLYEEKTSFNDNQKFINELKK